MTLTRTCEGRYLGTTVDSTDPVRKQALTKVSAEFRKLSEAVRKWARDRSLPDGFRFADGKVPRVTLPGDVKIRDMIAVAEDFICAGVVQQCLFDAGRTVTQSGLLLVRRTASGALRRARIAFKEVQGKLRIETNLEVLPNVPTDATRWLKVGRKSKLRDNLHLSTYHQP